MATRGHGEPRRCPLDGCPRTARAGQLMCGYHWRQVPKALQSDVWRTWRKWNRTHGDKDWQTYMIARRAALDAIENW